MVQFSAAWILSWRSWGREQIAVRCVFSPVTPVTFPVQRHFSNTEQASKGACDVEKSLHEQTEAPQSLEETQGYSAHRRKHGQDQGTRTESGPHTIESRLPRGTKGSRPFFGR